MNTNSTIADQSHGKLAELPVSCMAFLGLMFVLQIGYFMAFCREPVLWRDEAATVFLSTANWREMASVFLGELKTYSHSLVLTVWLKIFGVSEVAARSLSLVSVMTGSMLMFSGTRAWFGSVRLATMVTVLAGCSTVLLTYSIGNAVVYAFAFFTSAWLFAQVAIWLRQPSTGRLLLLIFASIVFMNVQPVNFVFAVGLGVAVAVKLLRTGPGLRENIQTLCVLASIFTLTAIPYLIQIIRNASVDTGSARIPLEQMTAGYFANIAWQTITHMTPLVHNVMAFLTDDYPGGVPKSVLQLPLIIMLAVVVFLGWIVYLYSRVLIKQWRGQLIEVAILFFVPVVLMGLAGMTNDRVTIPVKNFSGLVVGAALTVGVLLAPWRILSQAAIVAILIRSAVGLGWFISGTPGLASNAKEGVAHVMQSVQPDDIILLANTAMSPTFMYYYEGENEQWHFPYDHPLYYWRMTEMYPDQGDPVLLEKMLERIRKASEEQRDIWFITGGTPDPLPPGRWYSPDELPVLRQALADSFTPGKAAAFLGTDEPFTITKYSISEDDQESQP